MQLCYSSWHLNVGRGDSNLVLSALLNILVVMIFAGVARNDRPPFIPRERERLERELLSDESVGSSVFDTAILIGLHVERSLLALAK